MRSYAWPLLAAVVLTINACGSDQTATDAGVDGGGAGRGGAGGRGGSSAGGGAGGGTAGTTGGSAAGKGGGTAGTTGGNGGNGGNGGSTAGTGGGTAGSTGGNGGSTAGRGGSTAGTGGGTAGTTGGTGGSTAGTGGGSGGSTAGTGGGTAGTGGGTGGSTAGTGGGTAGSTGGSTAGTGGGSGGSTAGTTGTAGSTGGSTAGTGGGAAGSTGGSAAGTGGDAAGSTGTGTGGAAGTAGAGGTIACNNASTCPGGADDECKRKTCISNVCGMDFTAANTPVTGQTAEDCKRNVCDGIGGVLAAIYDADPPADDGNACTSETCVNGLPTRAPEPARTACTQDGGQFCNGSSATPACVVCLAASDCPGGVSICHLRVCGNQGTCGFSNAQAGTAAEPDATGNCQKAQCDGLGGTTSVADDTDAPADDGNPCTNDVCASGTPSHPARTNGTSCSQGSGIVCIGGTCVACQTVADCPGTDTPCRTRTCETDHSCGHVDAPQGTAAGTDATGNCQKPVCDGAGAVTSVADNSDKPVDDNVCTEDVCTNGTPSNPSTPAGTICVTDGSKACDGVGGCDPLTFRVVRLGTGASALSPGVAAPVFVEERKLDGSLVGTPVALPAAPGSGRMLTMSGSATSDGCLSLSSDGHYLALAGYDAAADTPDVVMNASTHVAGRIDVAGAVNTSTFFTMANASNNARGAATTDGTEFWVSGPGGSSAGGVWYNTLGAAGTETRVVSSPTNVRCVAVFNNQLYASSNGATNSLFSIGVGTPTGMNQSTTALPMLSTAGPFGFAMFDIETGVAGIDTVYLADELAGLQKWTFDGTNWSLKATLNAAGAGPGYRGVAGYAVGRTVTLMASSADSSPNRLVVFIDENNNVIPAGAVVAFAGGNTIFRGVALSPHFPAP